MKPETLILARTRPGLLEEVTTLMPNYTGSVIEAQVDYLTVSAHSEDRSRALSDLADDLLTGAERLGNERIGWRSMGYQGVHCGDIDWGRRDERQAILRVSGHRAAELLTPALAVSDYVSRLDVAVTWRATPPDPYLGQNAYTLALMHFAKHPRSAVPSQIRDALGGCTTQIGDRRSPYCGRNYNKEAERASQKDEDLAERYRACWRYEVECHDQRAVVLADLINAREDRAALIQAWSFEWWEKHGVPPAFPHSGAHAILPGFHRRTDDESRLRHLARDVAPTIRKLRARGRYQDALKALGLEDSNQTPPKD